MNFGKNLRFFPVVNPVWKFKSICVWLFICKVLFAYESLQFQRFSEIGKFIHKARLSNTEQLSAYIHKICISHEVTLIYQLKGVF